MIRRRLILVLFLLAAVPTAALEVVDPAEVAAGARGVCLTEVDGGELVEIPLEVLGTIGPSTPEGEIVLVRLIGERPAETGIVQGMSGSPVLVGGRLLGALAYGWPFAKEPIGGVTPFVHMRRLAEPPAGAGGTVATTGLNRPELTAVLEGVRTRTLGRQLVEWLAPAAASPTAGGLVPLAVPVSGRAPEAGWLAEAWARLGFAAAPAAAGGRAPAGEVRSRLVPGGMVAAVLAAGDVSLAAGGTVTAVEGDQVWAFGHPFLGGGDIRMPLADAHVLTVLPSVMSSFKMFQTGPLLGTFYADRARGLWGRLGETSPMVPVRVSADGRDYAFTTMRHPLLTPFLVGYLTSTSHAARGRTLGGQTVRMEVAVGYGPGLEARMSETFVGGDAPAQAAALASALVAYLEASSFAKPELASVDIVLDAAERLETAEILQIVPDRRTVRPGDTVTVSVRVREREAEAAWHRIEVTVPDRLRPGRLDLVVADGASWSAYDLRMRPQASRSFADELGLVERIEPSTRLVAALERRDPALISDRGVVPAPAGILLELSGGLGDGLRTAAWGVVNRAHVDVGHPLAGASRTRLEVVAAGRNPAHEETQ